jgi:hypothetical protein
MFSDLAEAQPKVSLRLRFDMVSNKGKGVSREKEEIKWLTG